MTRILGGGQYVAAWSHVRSISQHQPGAEQKDTDWPGRITKPLTTHVLPSANKTTRLLTNVQLWGASHPLPLKAGGGGVGVWPMDGILSEI